MVVSLGQEQLSKSLQGVKLAVGKAYICYGDLEIRNTIVDFIVLFACTNDEVFVFF